MADQNVHPEAGRPPFNYGPWSWREPSRGEHFRRCSWCGSVHPEDLAAETGWVAQWADRKYGWPHKFYVDIPNRAPEALFVISSIWGDRAEAEPGYVAVADLTDEQRVIAERDGSLTTAPDGRGPRYLAFGTRPMHPGKFYSIHLSDADLDPAVKQTIEQQSGLAFQFRDGQVAWRRAS